MALVNALTTLANAKAIAGIPTAVTTYDAAIELLINRVSTTIRKYLGRSLIRTAYTEKIPATSRQFLVLKECPIVSITSLTLNGKALVLNTDYRLDAQDKESGMVYKEDGWDPILLVSGLTMDVVAAARSIDIVYEAGYYLPADVTTLPADPHYVAGDPTSLPMDIQGIVDEMVAAKITKVKLQSYGLSSYSEGGIAYGWKVMTESAFMGISDEHAMVLNGYKKFVVA